MSEKVIKGSRSIKTFGKPYKKGDLFLHPLTLNLIKVKDDNIVPSELNYIDNRPNLSIKKDVNYSNEEIQKFMTLPYLNLNNNALVYFYEIETIDQLNSFIDVKINSNYPINNLLRIVNIWIKHNFNDLIKYNNYIYNIFKKINDKYWKIEHKKENVIIYFNKWINNKNIDDFQFDFFEDLLIFIKK